MCQVWVWGTFGKPSLSSPPICLRSPLVALVSLFVGYIFEPLLEELDIAFSTSKVADWVCCASPDVPPPTNRLRIQFKEIRHLLTYFKQSQLLHWKTLSGEVKAGWHLQSAGAGSKNMGPGSGRSLGAACPLRPPLTSRRVWRRRWWGRGSRSAWRPWNEKRCCEEERMHTEPEGEGGGWLSAHGENEIKCRRSPPPQKKPESNMVYGAWAMIKHKKRGKCIKDIGFGESFSFRFLPFLFIHSFHEEN